MLTETWIKEDDNITPARLCPKGYKSLSIPRLVRTGGGTAMVFKKDLNVTKACTTIYITMEMATFQININNCVINLVTIYRPPDTNILDFCHEFTDILEQHINQSGELVLMGDFNIAVNRPFDPDPSTFLDTLDSFNLVNKIKEPTHWLSNTLDLIIHNADSTIVPSTKVGRLFSDHYMVFFRVSFQSLVKTSRTQAYRKYTNIDHTAFSHDIKKELEGNLPGKTLQEKIQCYNNTLSSVLDTHAPVKHCKCSNKPKVPWFNDTIAKAIHNCRKLERTWYKDKTNNKHFTAFYHQCRLVVNLLDKAECEFFLNLIAENSNNYRQIYTICSQLLGRTKESTLPPGFTNQELADRFNNYFIDKIAKIRSVLLEKCSHLPNYVEVEAAPNRTLPRFCNLSQQEVRKRILATPNKSCELDPILTDLLKHILPWIIELITDIVNLSLDDDMFPDTLKEALVKPLLKKANLDLIANNFRPVSNLAYISKLAKCAATSQLTEHINRFNLMESNQLAYRALHSTETALLKVKTDIISALDHQEVACLILLNLSAAFDTIDHFTLLQQCFAVSGTLLNWFCSYLTNRTQAVVIGNILSDGCKSAPMPLTSGIPQGWSLDPFCSHCTQYCLVIFATEIEFHLYMDDTQIYMTFKPSVPVAKEECIAKVGKSITKIDIWMSQNLLKLNRDKTEFII